MKFSGLKYSTLLTAILLMALFAPLGAMPKYVPGQILIKTSAPIEVKGNKTGLSGLDSFLSAQGVEDITHMKRMPGGRYYRINLSSMPDAKNLEDMSFDGVEYIQPNYIRKMHVLPHEGGKVQPNDPYFARQQLDLIGAPQAWNYSTGSSEIIVGVVDSGMLVNHPDLKDNVYRNLGEIPDDGIDNDNNGYIDDVMGWDFVHAPELEGYALGDYLDEDNDVHDESHHGTHVSGIIGAKGNNSLGVSGVCWNVRLMPLRAGFRTMDAGYLKDDDVSAAIIYGADNGCKVINMSWGDTSYSPIIADACDYAYSKGVVLVASAGNDGTSELHYPARLANVIAVGSASRAKLLSNFSSHGQGLDLLAPGELILSTYKDEGDDLYYEQSGTSMSAPFVSGAIALMLSIQPDLTPDEIRARLLSSTDDIYAPGYDHLSGHGFLNVEKFIRNSNPPFAKIDYPVDHGGISKTTNLIGSVYDDDFIRYTLMYKKVDKPDLPWLDITEHSQTPTYHLQPVHNDILGEFRVPSNFPAGDYLIRLQTEKRLDATRKYNYFTTIRVQRDTPEIRDGSLQHFSRYEDENLRHYIAAAFNDKVNANLTLSFEDGSLRDVYGTKLDTVQVWTLPRDIPEGKLSLRVVAENLSGIRLESPWYNDFCEIVHNSIPRTGYSAEEIGEARVPLNKWYDFNGNDIDEYVAMDIPESGYGELFAYEPRGNSHPKTHTFREHVYPLDIGATTPGGMDLLVLQGEKAMLWSNSPGFNYPRLEDQIFSDNGILGGAIADYNGDGRQDLLLIKNLPQARVLQLYGRTTEGIFSPRNTIYNDSPTDLRNNFVPTIIVDKFKSGSRPQIITADTDGDVMIFEVEDNLNYIKLWEHRLPVANAYHLAAGDFDGDGKRDFVVAGYNNDPFNPDNNFWHVEAFTYEDNDFVSMDSIMFEKVESQSAITVVDMDDDGKDEIVLAIAPNLYILKYENGKLNPVFIGDSILNYRVASWIDSDGVGRVIANREVEADSLVCAVWKKDDIGDFIPAPNNVFAQALGPDSAKISWTKSDADSYKLYRRDEDGDILTFDLGNTDHHVDLALKPLKSYSYAVQGIYSDPDQPESVLSSWQDVALTELAEVDQIFMNGPKDLRILFNMQMPTTIVNPALYHLSHDMGYPLSVNKINSGHGVQLRFREALPEIDELFTIDLQGIRGPEGIPLQSSSYTFSYSPDMEAPQITGVRILSKNDKLEITFSEEIEPTSAQHLPNYRFSPPDNDAENEITAVQVHETHVVISFKHKLKHSKQGYFIEIANVCDLAGNMISPAHNLARFALSDIGDLDELVVFPNPLRKTEQDALVFMNFPAGQKGKIAIYNSNGILIYKDDIGPFNPEINDISWRWNARNQKGEKISSGIYFYVIEMNKKTARGKFAVIN
ncbi:MAG TPA: S8 family serine peptidase [Candidatus Cloacimonetes bacterium]|nr:S8 family serine peptidase [Candidatus Cloacimonadota bacterium]